MGKYCRSEAVKVRLEGKVKFSESGSEDENRMSPALLNALIAEAESQLEIDMMDRYELPFQSTCGAPFSQLPQTSLITIQNLAELLSCIRVLETDFGRGTSVNSEKYTEKLQKRYDEVVGKLMEVQEQTKHTSRQWLRRPLDGVKVSYNNQGDNGFRGRVTNVSAYDHNAANYAIDQINSPGENIFNGLDFPFGARRGN